MHKQLVEAIAALDEVYRETIIMRFVDGFTAAEIARRSNVPAATVRSRTKRGLEMLRVDLDGRSDGDRSTWRAAMLPLIGPEAFSTAATAAGGAGSLVKWVIAVVVATAFVAAAVRLAPMLTRNNDHKAADAAQSAVVLEISGDAAPVRSVRSAQNTGPRQFSNRAQRASFAEAIAAARAGKRRARKTFDYSGDQVRPYPTIMQLQNEQPALDKNYLRRQIRGAMPLLAECFELAVVTSPELEGTMTIDFVVDAEDDVGGYVREASVADGSPLTDEVLAECVIETVYSLEFRAPEAGGEVVVRYPLEFVREAR